MNILFNFNIVVLFVNNLKLKKLFRVLLQNTDVTLAAGRRYGLVGRNGLGKTTLLRMISG